MTGTREALGGVFGSQRQRFLSEALRVFGNHEHAEEALQEALLAALRSLHRFEDRARLSTWLTRVVINAALMRQRNLRARESGSIEEPIPGQGGACLPDRLVDSQPNPEEAFLRAERRRILMQVLQRLSQPYRRALSLQVLHDITPKRPPSRWVCRSAL
jgi:RNA polymerase sigma-70 factor (ECF subfamily)